MRTEHDEAVALARAIQAERMERVEAEVERLRAQRLLDVADIVQLLEERDNARRLLAHSRVEVRRLLEERDDARQSVVDLTAHISETARARGVRIRRARRWHRSTR
jgi:hypothetical protein